MADPGAVGRNGFSKRYAYKRTRNNEVRRKPKAKIYDLGRQLNGKEEET
jgi:hypothetical protein